MNRTVALMCLLAGVVVSGVACIDPANDAAQSPAVSSVIRTLSDAQTDGFIKATQPITFQFPEDHGSHPDFKNEWWYFTGNLTSDVGQQFGFQFTLFRSALSPRTQVSDSAWTTRQTYMAHLAVTDVSRDAFYSDERFARGALELAGVSVRPFRAWLEDWSVSEVGLSAGCVGCLVLRIAAANDTVSIALSLTSKKPVVRHGQKGLSYKSETLNNASYYYSLTRLHTSGSVRIHGRTYSVDGLSWFDHEWSTSALEDDQVGWDWFSLHLSDDSDLMLFRLRDRRGPLYDYVSGTHIDADGNVQTLARRDFRIQTLAQWQSPHTRVRYPARWQIDLPGQNLALTVSPWIRNQEMDLTFRYWEGAVRVHGTQDTRRVTGSGYVELTGYD